jgi:hypothetical protein
VARLRVWAFPRTTSLALAAPPGDFPPRKASAGDIRDESDKRQAALAGAGALFPLSVLVQTPLSPIAVRSKSWSIEPVASPRDWWSSFSLTAQVRGSRTSLRTLTRGLRVSLTFGGIFKAQAL